MKVLGFSPLDKDSTVTLIEDGRIMFAAGEERFSRVKLQDGFPWRARKLPSIPLEPTPRTSTLSLIRSCRGTKRPAFSEATSRPNGNSSPRARVHRAPSSQKR